MILLESCWLYKLNGSIKRFNKAKYMTFLVNEKHEKC